MLDHRRDFCLLQHDLRNPHAIGITTLPPWQIARMCVIPPEQHLLKLARVDVSLDCLSGHRKPAFYLNHASAFGTIPISGLPLTQHSGHEIIASPGIRSPRELFHAHSF